MSLLRRLWPQHGLWQHADFLKLWSAQTISQVGSQISGLVLPLVALLTLHASAFEVAALSVVDFLPFLLFTLPAGVWVDRLPRRPIMVIADVGRALVLVSIPVAVLVGGLTLSQLYVVGFATGTLTVFFEVAYQSYLPSLVERSDLVDGNAKLETTRSSALIGGPALGGLLVHALTAPYAVLADALSFVWSALFVSSIRRSEVVPERSTGSPSMWRELTEGVRYIFGHQYWRAITVATAIYNFFNYVAFAILVVYMVRRLHMSALAIGVTLSLSNCGALIAAFFAQRIGRRLGLGRAIVLATFFGFPLVLVPVAPGSYPIPFIIVAFTLEGFGGVLYTVSTVSLIQALTPERLLGRANASRRFVVWGTIPLGGLVSGALASWIGLRPTLFIGTLGCALSAIPILLSPIRHIKAMPTDTEEAGARSA
jgi:MFS family permease